MNNHVVDIKQCVIIKTREGAKFLYRYYYTGEVKRILAGRKYYWEEIPLNTDNMFEIDDKSLIYEMCNNLLQKDKGAVYLKNSSHPIDKEIQSTLPRMVFIQ